MQTNPVNLTRRTLFTAGGMLVSSFFLPAIPDQPGKYRLAGPRSAAAADRSETFSVDVASEWTVQFKVFDVAHVGFDADTPGLAGATVTVTPLDVSGVPATTVVTNENGFAVVEINGYCSEVSAYAPHYTCNAQVDIRLDGHKQVRIYKMALIGTCLYALPSPKIADGKEGEPYFRSIALNGWDVQYNDATFLYSSTYEKTYPITMEVFTKAGGSKAYIEVWRWHTGDPSAENLPAFVEKTGSMSKLGRVNLDGDNGQHLGSQTHNAEDEYMWKATIEGPWLRKDHNKAFSSENDRLVVRLVTADLKELAYISYANFKEAPVNLVDSGNLSLFPSVLDGDLPILQFSLPDWVPGYSQSVNITLNLPKFNLVYGIYYLGKVGGKIGYGYVKRGFGKDTINPFKADAITMETVDDTVKAWTDIYGKRFNEAVEYAGASGVAGWARDHLLPESWRVPVPGENDDAGDGGQGGEGGDGGDGGQGGDGSESGGSSEGSDGDESSEDAAVQPEGENGELQQQKYKFWSVYMALGIQGYGEFTYNPDYSAVTGSLNIIGFFNISWSFNRPFLIGIVPFYFSFGITLSTNAQFRAAWAFPLSSDDSSLLDHFLNFFRDASFDFQNSRLAVTFTPCFTLALGAGVRDAITLGVRGSLSFPFYLALWEGVRQSQGELDPRFKIQLTASVCIFLQVYILKFNYTICQVDPIPLVDTFELPTNATLKAPRSVDYPSNTTISELSLGSKKKLQLTSAGGTELSFNLGEGISLAQIAKLADENSSETLMMSADAFETVREGSVFTTESSATVQTHAVLTEAAEAPKAKVTLTDNGDGTFKLVRKYSKKSDAATNGAAANEAAGPDTKGDPKLEATFSEAMLSVLNDASTLPEGWENLPVSVEAGYTYKPKSKLHDFGSKLSSFTGVSEQGVTIAPAKILGGVHSDGRPKFARVSSTNTDGTHLTRLAMFRLASVKYDDIHRTRLVVQYKTETGWTDAEPIDFTVAGVDGVTRGDLNDYDFDVSEFTFKAPNEDVERSYVGILLLSGLCDTNDATKLSFEDVATKPVTSLLVFGKQFSNAATNKNEDGTWNFAPVVRDAVSWRTLDPSTNKEGYGNKKIMVYAPSISAAAASSTQFGRLSTAMLNGAYLYRQVDASAGKNAIFEDSVEPQARAFSAAISALSYTNFPTSELFYDELTLETLNLMSYMAGGMASLCAGPASCSSPTNQSWNGTAFFGYTTANGSGIFHVDHVRWLNSVYWVSDDLFYDDTSVGRTMAAKSDIKRFVNWSGRQSLIALKRVEDGEDARIELHSIDLSSTKSVSDKDIVQLGAEEDTPADFYVSPTGEYLLYAVSKEGEAEAQQDENGAAIVDDEGNIKTDAVDPVYSIMAMRAVTDSATNKTLFTKPFVLAEVDCPVDSVTAAAGADEATDIMFYHITDLASSECDYYQVRVPCVASVTPVALSSIDDYPTAGKDCTFKLELHNDGNALVKGVTISVLDADNNDAPFIENLEILFNENTMLETSNSEPAAEVGESTAETTYVTGYENFPDHPLAKNGGCTLIAPGKSAAVAVKFKIPQEWSGAHNITVKTSRVRYVNPITGEEATTSTVEQQQDGSTNFFSAAALTSSGTVSTRFGQQEGASLKINTLASADGTTERLNGPRELSGTYREDGSGAVDGGGSGGGAGGTSGGQGGSKGSGKAGMPDTGDVAGLASLAAGALGAGLLAYSRRRAEIEAEAEES